jgi:hypothetical protein
MSEIEDLRAWLVDMLASKCTRFDLRRRGIASEERCGTVHADASADVGRLAEDLLARASRDARHFRGPQSYIVGASSDEEGADEIRTIIEVPGGRDALERGVDVEGASTAGLLGQLMRHNEADQKAISGNFSAVCAGYDKLLAARDRIIEQRDARIAELEARELKVHDLFERLTTAEHERRLELHRVEQQDKRAEYAVQKLDLLLPLVASKVGTRVLGETKAAGGPMFGEEMLRQLLRSLDESQVTGILASLRPEQAAIVGELYVAYAEREQKKATEAESPGAATPPAAAANAPAAKGNAS